MTRTDQLVAVLGAGLTGVVLGVAAGTGVELGNLAEWAQAIGTVGAFYLTYRLLAHEVAVRRAAEEEQIWAQAKRVSVTVSGSTSGTLANPQTGEMAKPFSVDVKANILNDSSDVITTVFLTLGLVEDGITTPIDVVSLGMLAPKQQQPAGCSIQWSGSQEGFERWAVVMFTDAEQRTWRRYSNGTLEPVDSGSGSIAE